MKRYFTYTGYRSSFRAIREKVKRIKKLQFFAMFKCLQTVKIVDVTFCMRLGRQWSNRERRISPGKNCVRIPNGRRLFLVAAKLGSTRARGCHLLRVNHAYAFSCWISVHSNRDQLNYLADSIAEAKK
jgi:hypothetical protein